jgi:hypothetical protein
METDRNPRKHKAFLHVARGRFRLVIEIDRGCLKTQLDQRWAHSVAWLDKQLWYVQYSTCLRF